MRRQRRCAQLRLATPHRDARPIPIPTAVWQASHSRDSKKCTDHLTSKSSTQPALCGGWRCLLLPSCISPSLVADPCCLHVALRRLHMLPFFISVSFSFGVWPRAVGPSRDSRGARGCWKWHRCMWYGCRLCGLRCFSLALPCSSPTKHTSHVTVFHKSVSVCPQISTETARHAPRDPF